MSKKAFGSLTVCCGYPGIAELIAFFCELSCFICHLFLLTREVNPRLVLLRHRHVARCWKALLRYEEVLTDCIEIRSALRQETWRTSLSKVHIRCEIWRRNIALTWLIALTWYKAYLPGYKTRAWLEVWLLCELFLDLLCFIGYLLRLGECRELIHAEKQFWWTIQILFWQPWVLMFR